MKTSRTFFASRRAGRGISLIVVLIMLVIIGITAATAMRSATSEQRATNNLRVQNTAQQYAEAALRYCEQQMFKPDGTRAAGFNTTDVPAIPASTTATAKWTNALTWTTAGNVAGRFTLANTQISDADTTPPTNRPQCMVETQTMQGQGASTFTQTVITARGFSGDYVADAVSGKTTQGSVVWLQSIINAQ